MSFADDGSSSLAMSMSVFGIIACPSCVFLLSLVVAISSNIFLHLRFSHTRLILLF